MYYVGKLKGCTIQLMEDHGNPASFTNIKDAIEGCNWFAIGVPLGQIMILKEVPLRVIKAREKKT